jgi:hypothetical protein
MWICAVVVPIAVMTLTLALERLEHRLAGTEQPIAPGTDQATSRHRWL